jgi:hypothetical protein
MDYGHTYPDLGAFRGCWWFGLHPYLGCCLDIDNLDLTALWVGILMLMIGGLAMTGGYNNLKPLASSLDCRGLITHIEMVKDDDHDLSKLENHAALS